MHHRIRASGRHLSKVDHIKPNNSATTSANSTNTMRLLTTTLLLTLTAIISAETVVHHGIVGHFENIGPCPAHLTVPKCEDKAKWCEQIQMCTKPEGHCSRDGKGCVDIRFNRDVCVKPYNWYPGGYCGMCTSLL